jgi:hypothetical protein
LQGRCELGWFACLLAHEYFWPEHFETHFVCFSLRYYIVARKSELESNRGFSRVGDVPYVLVFFFIFLVVNNIARNKREFKVFSANICAVP